MNEIRTVELFAGVGGFRLGLESASERYKFIWANQWEPSMQEQYAFDCYTSHFGKFDSHVCKDIAIAKDSIPEHDFLVGGFPCQDYSIMKKNSAGIEGSKGILWWQIDDILEKKRPPFVLLENVDRILRSPSKQAGRDFSIILRCFYEKGYAVEWRVINASDYGQSQRRRRTFIIAYSNQTNRFKCLAEDVCIHGIKSMHRYIMTDSILAKAFPVISHEQAYTDNWIDEMKYTDIPQILSYQKVALYNAGVMMNGRIYSVDVAPDRKPFIPLQEIIESNILDDHYYLKDKDLKLWSYIKGAKNEQRKRKDGSVYYFTEGSVPFPDPLYKPSRTMLTSEGEIGRATHVIKDLNTGKLRTLTPIECERLNGFPDNWTNTGMPERMRYFCMGNALVVPLITQIGSVLVNEKDISHQTD